MGVWNLRTIGRWVLAIVVVESALAIGTVHTSALIVLVVLAGIAAALLYRPAPMRMPAKILAAVSIGWTLFTIIQLIPMPASWVAVLSPHAADVWARCLRPLGEPGPSWIPLTVDPVATRIQAARGIAYTLTFFAALSVARDRAGMRFLVTTLVVSGAVITIAALLHPAFDQRKVFGVYTPQNVIALRHIGPLLNANHLSAYLNITLCCAIGIALDEDLGRMRIMPAAIGAIVLATQFWVASRGGVVSMVIGVAAVITLRFLRARSIAFAPLTLGILIIGGIVMGVYGQWDEAWNEIADTDVSKIHLFAQVLPMLRAYPIFGVGRGAFESAFPEFRTSVGYDVFTHPEDILLQWGAEWGVPLALAGTIALLVALRPSVAMVRGRWAVGAWAALAAVGIHNLVDFSSETPGVVVALCVCAAVVAGGTASRGIEQREKAAPTWGPAVLAVLFGVLLALTSVGRDVETDRNALIAERTDAATKFDRATRAALLRHPAEPYLPYVGALHAHGVGASAMPWLERTLERSPIYGPAHLLLASELVGRSPAQARLEDRIGIEQMIIRETTYGVVHEAVRQGLVRSYEDAIELVPSGREHDPALEILSSLIAAKLPASAFRLDSLRTAHPPVSTYVTQRRAQAGLEDLRAGSSSEWCEADRAACTKAALDAVRAFQSADMQSCDSHALEAQIRVEVGDAREAFLELRRFMRSIPQQGSCIAQLAQVAIAAKLPTEADATIEQLARAPCTTSNECTSNLLSAAALALARNNPRRALAYYDKAAELAPERTEISVRAADLATSLGMFTEARTAYERLVKQHPENAAYRDGLKQANQGLLRLRIDDVSLGSP